ncbi:hypothetical protein [Mucilaginibacter jinjuensis]|uniref:Uncharacterized protein n=1 Tax=Mucilaginibacter jinjuensis TaxID=1176721 RepID=A0ABY7T2B2_9SPHI|nr:hypothetical protein [Mucilaginibacter jinjuensis]WCT10384.1 hypothetical protein PQO05_16740 [Mucilaginibacter jinjuensis]
MNLNYAILFSVELMHDYYTDQRCPDFAIVPTAETAVAMKNMGMVYKFAGNQLFVLVRVNESGLPLIPIQSTKNFVFAMLLQHVHFYNFTNLSYTPSAPQRYYFSNTNQNQSGTDVLLQSKIALYNNATTYNIGDLVATNTGNIYEALKPGSGNALTNTDAWLNRNKVQYVNGGDLITLAPYITSFAVTPANTFTVNVNGLNNAGTAYDQKVLDTINLTYDTAQSTIQLKLDNLPSGKYSIDINGQKNLIYIDSTLAASRDVFGIINIVNNYASPSVFGLFDAAGKPNKTRFVIRFANRAVIWRYIARTADVTSVNDSRPAPDKYTFTAGDPNEFISVKPIPFNQQPVNTLSIESTSLGNISPIANPTINRLGTINKDGFNYYCSELHLNY